MDRWNRIRETLGAADRRERRFRANSHELDYGRHAGPPPYDARQAAVLVLLTELPAGWHLPLMVRPARASTHAGQVSLPGGRMEEGETPEACAVRETVEELGIAAEDVELVGRMSPVYIYASNNEMIPCLGVARRIPDFCPNPHEVARVFWMPIAALFEPARRGSHEIRRWGAAFQTPHIQWESERIWGATRIVLDELAELWKSFGLGDGGTSGILTPSTTSE